MSRLVKRPLSWEPGAPAATIQQVWDYVSEQIRECKLQLGRVEVRYHGRHQTADEHAKFLCTILKQTKVHAVGKDPYMYVIETLSGNLNNNTRLTAELKDWIEDIKTIKATLNMLRNICHTDIFGSLTTYCSSYHPTIGANDDKLFTLYRSKIISIKKTMLRIDSRLESLDKPETLISIDEMELLQCDCQGGHVLTKIIPLLIDDFEKFLDKSYDWITIDKCYMDEIQTSINKSRKQLRKLDKQCKLAGAAYHTTLVTLRRERVVLDSLVSELSAFSVRELREMEQRSHHVDLEIQTLEHSLDKLTKEEIADDVPDCCLDVFEDETSHRADIIYYQKR